MKSAKKVVSALLAASIACSPVAAAPVPAGPNVTIVARDQPIAAFLRDLFGQAGRSLVLSPKLTGTISGTFNGPVDRVFRDVSRAFALVGYFDGTAVHVYPSSDISSQTLSLTQWRADRVARAAARLRDPQNTIRRGRDGSLVVTGTPRFVEQVSELARTAAGAVEGEGDGRALAPAPLAVAPPTPLEFRVFYLRYARAEDTTITSGGREVRVPGVATILRSLVGDGRGTSGASYGSRTIRQSAQRVGGTGLAATSPDSSQAPILGLPYNGLPVLGAEPAEAAAAPASDPNAVRIEVNPFTNAVIVRDAPERMRSYEGLIAAIDVEPQLIEVEATIIDINTERLRRLGINWRVSSGGFSALLGNGNADSDTRLLPRFDLSRRDNANNITPSADGFALSTIIGSGREFLGRINALEARGAARVISRPQVITLSNLEAVFDRTRTFYVRVAGRQNVDLFNVTAGTVLRVNPHVFRDQDQTRIRMVIQIEDGNVTAGEVDDIPIVERSGVSTQALILEGESLLLGGMTVDSSIDNVDKLPLLGDIPVLGNLFKTRVRQRGRTERLFLITPRLATLGPRLSPAALPAVTPVPATPEGTRPNRP